MTPFKQLVSLRADAAALRAALDEASTHFLRYGSPEMSQAAGYLSDAICDVQDASSAITAAMLWEKRHRTGEDT